jgi:Zn-dependent metalloprotease
MVAVLCLAANAAASPPTLHSDPKTGRALVIRNEAVAGRIISGAVPAASAPQLSASAVSTTDAAQASAAPPALISREEAIAIAQRHLDAHGSRFTQPAPLNQLAVTRVISDPDGMSFVRYEQRCSDIPVVGAELIVALKGRELCLLGGRVLHAPEVKADLRITAAQATEKAIALWQAALHFPGPPIAELAQLKVVSPGFLSNEPDETAYVVWEVPLLSEPPGPLSAETYFIDVSTGELRFRLSNLRHLREVYDCSYQPGTDQCKLDVAYGGYIYGRSEGQPPRGPNPNYSNPQSFDVNSAYDALGGCLDYMLMTFGQNGPSGQGGYGDGVNIPTSTARVYTYLNFLSMWADDCEQANFYKGRIRTCKGVADPITMAHEYGHAIGYWAFLNNIGAPEGMTYENQAASLEENHADVFGLISSSEFTGIKSWRLVNNTGYVIRDISDPPSVLTGPIEPRDLPFADRYYSPYYSCFYDGYGVYINSTIPGKAAFLAADGGNFNGCAIQAIGSEKVSRIWHRAYTRYYAKAETFNGAYYKLIQAAIDLYGSGSEEALQLTRALQSVELDQAGGCSGVPLRFPGSLDVEGW